MTTKVKATVKNALLRMFPRAATQLFSARARAYSQRLAKRWGCTQLNRKMIQQVGNRVLHGPFSGMVLSSETCREHLSPFLLGTYENELHDVWKTILTMQFYEILDIGAKFGFYAIGLARRFPSIPVFAFDTDPWAREATRQMCSANDVNINVLGFCSPEWMRQHLQKNSFVFSDCEGFEATLFVSVEIPNLASATMLIEIHEQFSPGVENLIRNRYSKSHDIVSIPSRLTTLGPSSELTFLNQQEKQMAVEEFRAFKQSWLFLKPRT